MFDLQGMIDSMNESTAKNRGNYHLTYGDLVNALKAAPPDATFDGRVKGIGSWRGSYIEIALFTESEGFTAEKSEFTAFGSDNFQETYSAWEKENIVSAETLPTNANELGSVLESLIGLQFVGYKGGNYTVEEWKPLWLETDESTYSSVAVIGIDDRLNLVTKELDV